MKIQTLIWIVIATIFVCFVILQAVNAYTGNVCNSKGYDYWHPKREACQSFIEDGGQPEGLKANWE